MNATFRRDYLYANIIRLKSEVGSDIEAGTYLRYLKYSKDLDSFIFLTGKRRHDAELTLIMPRNRSVPIKQVKFNGYESTDGYTSEIGKYITKFNNLKIGGIYRFIETPLKTDQFISNKLLKLASVEDGKASLNYLLSHYDQTLLKNWIDDGYYKAIRIG